MFASCSSSTVRLDSTTSVATPTPPRPSVSRRTPTRQPGSVQTLVCGCACRRLDIAKIAQVTDRTLELLSPLTAITALKLGCNAWDLYPLTGRSFVMFRRWRGLRVLHLEACRNLQKDAFIAIAAACPQLECLHLDTASRITPAAFGLATMCSPPPPSPPLPPTFHGACLRVCVLLCVLYAELEGSMHAHARCAWVCTRTPGPLCGAPGVRHSSRHRPVRAPSSRA